MFIEVKRLTVACVHKTKCRIVFRTNNQVKILILNISIRNLNNTSS